MLTVVTGPPCAGKSTYVQQRTKPGDVVVDFDAIAQALGSPVSHGHPSHVLKVAIEAREAAIRAAVASHHRGARVWLIDSRPAPGRRSWLGSQGARFVTLRATAAELHRRAEVAGRPQEWHARIDEYLAAPHRGDPPPEGRTRW